jgi:hypothetical protein
MRIYSAQLGRKYARLERRQKDEAGENEQVYSTDEGDVLLSISGSNVFVSEGFDLALARKLRDNVANAQAEGPLRVVQLDHEPALSMAHQLSSYGILRPALMGRYTSEGQPANRLR